MIKSNKMADRRYIAEEILKHADEPGAWRYSENMFELARGYLELEEKNLDLQLQVRRLEATCRTALAQVITAGHAQIELLAALSEAVELADQPKEFPGETSP